MALDRFGFLSLTKHHTIEQDLKTRAYVITIALSKRMEHKSRV